MRSDFGEGQVCTGAPKCRSGSMPRRYRHSNRDHDACQDRWSNPDSEAAIRQIVESRMRSIEADHVQSERITPMLNGRQQVDETKIWRLYQEYSPRQSAHHVLRLIFSR